jgi:hypothetical protein
LESSLLNQQIIYKNFRRKEMIIVMKSNYTPQHLEGVVDAIKAQGLTPHITYGVGTAIVAAVGEFHVPSLDQFEVLDGVESVKRISQPYKLGSRQVHPENSVFPIDGFSIGGDDIALIAGPCSVESKSQILETAHAVREAGANALRGPHGSIERSRSRSPPCWQLDAASIPAAEEVREGIETMTQRLPMRRRK